MRSRVEQMSVPIYEVVKGTGKGVERCPGLGVLTSPVTVIARETMKGGG